MQSGVTLSGINPNLTPTISDAPQENVGNTGLDNINWGLIGDILAAQDPSNYRYEGYVTQGGLDIGEPNRQVLTPSQEQIDIAKQYHEELAKKVLGNQYESLTQDTTANDMLDPNVTNLPQDETIVTDDPQTEWDKLDKTTDFQDLLGKAMDIFGAYNRDAIKNVVDVVNDRGMSVYEVAGATGNTVESINQAAAESGATINNQEAPSVLTGGEASVGSGDTVIDQTPDLRGTGTPTGRVIGDGVTPEPKPVVTDDTTVTDVVTTPSVPTTPDIVEPPITPTVPDIVEPPITPTVPDVVTPTTPTTPKTNITLMQSIVNDTPITESILFEPKFTTLDNIPQGLFGRIYRAAGGR